MELMFISSPTSAAGCDVGADAAAAGEEDPGRFFHLWNMLHWMRSLGKSTFLLFTSRLLQSVTSYFLLLWFFKLVHRSRSERFCCQLFKRRLMSFFFFHNGFPVSVLNEHQRQVAVFDLRHVMPNLQRFVLLSNSFKAHQVFHKKTQNLNEQKELHVLLLGDKIGKTNKGSV